MADRIERVVFPELFWRSLEHLRGHPRYPAIRSQIDELVAFKKVSNQRINQRDKPFNPKLSLSGIWHWACCRNPDIVLFYTIEAKTMTMAMVGDHHDYQFQGRGARAQENTARRIANAIKSPHVSPEWKSIGWKRPSDITSHPDLFELSKNALRTLDNSLRQELEDGEIFKRVFGVSIYDSNVEDFDAWIDETTEALKTVAQALRMTPTTPEASLEMAVERHSALAFAP